MSINSNKKFTGAICFAVILTMAQDEFDLIHADYVNYVMQEGGNIRKM